MSNKEPGYVYILTNPSFREDWVKIGKSSRPVDVRSKELDNTAVPLPFEIFATMKTVKYNEVEKLVHKTIDRLTDLRIRQNREFFNVPPKMALDIFRDIAMAIDDAEITEYESNVPLNPETNLVEARIVNTRISETSSLQLEFWNKFNENAYSNDVFLQTFKLRKAYAQHWYDLSIGSSAYHLCMTASRQKQELSIGIYITDNKSLFNLFKSHSADIEKVLECKLEWREAVKATRFLTTRDFDLDRKELWIEAFKWLYDMCLKFKTALSQFDVSLK
ncbi:MAG: DUF4268 domain-containing protein [Bacteroidaceae bacterium]|nr:DUF4268 domain-containing protein [Bacteroidaceae bacterium]